MVKANSLSLEDIQGRPSDNLADSRRVSEVSQAEKVVEDFVSRGKQKGRAQRHQSARCTSWEEQSCFNGVADVSWETCEMKLGRALQIDLLGLCEQEKSLKKF